MSRSRRGRAKRANIRSQKTRRFARLAQIPTPQRMLVQDDNSGWKSGVTFLLPNLPIRTDRLEHGFGGVVQPLSLLLVDVAEDEFAGRWGAEMDVGGFPSHGVEQ